MKRIIFSGTSHTLGLGLELELHPRFSDVNWLEKNGVFQTFLIDEKYGKEDYEICKKWRWTKLVSDELGYIEFNCHDNGPMKGGTWPPGPIQFLKVLGEKTDEELKDVEHIVIQTNHLRYTPIEGVTMLDALYGGMTPTEILEYLEDKTKLDSVKEKIYEWIANYDEINEIRNFSKRIGELKNQFPYIKFHILIWDSLGSVLIKENLKEIWDDLITINYNGITSLSMEQIKNKFNLSISDTAFCYVKNQNFLGFKRWEESGLRDQHLNKLGHRVLADNVIRKIKAS